MKNKVIITLLIASTFLLIGCCFKHDFSEATCTVPSTCNKCGKIQGEVIPHTFVDATCTEPKTCSVCNLTEGAPLEHQWVDATTENPKTCNVCGLTEGEPLPAEETITDGVDSTSTDAILGEDEYQGDEPEVKSFDEATQNVLKSAKELYEAGLLTKEEYDEVVKDGNALNNN